MVGLKSGCQSDAEFWAAVAELRGRAADAVVAVIRGLGTASGASSDAEDPVAYGAEGAMVARSFTLTPTGPGEVGWAEGVTVAKKRGPKPLAERTPEQQAAHAAKKAAKAAAAKQEEDE